jgi:3-deoxy-D-manno-octulosonic-acid transferase
MVWLWWAIYNLVILPLMSLVVTFSIPFNSKVRRGIKGRRKTLNRVARFRDGIFDRFGPLYWFHAASLGEFEQSRPVIEGLREVSPESIIAVSFFSPSGYEHCHHAAVDFKFYLPVDFPWLMRQLLRELKPHKVIFASYDIWPNLIWNCRRAGIQTTLFAARIVIGSSKQWPVLSSFYRYIYGAIGHVYTVSEADYQRVVHLLGKKSSTVVMNLGNPRYDRVKERSRRTLSTSARNGNNRTLILGSMHKEDHEVVSPIILECLRSERNLKVYWAPHEPLPQVINAIGTELTAADISWNRYANQCGMFENTQVLIVDGIGYLAELYSHGILAYVGGGFGSNVHNVMEPAIAGIPVLFGPKHSRSHEAEQLLASGGGFSIATSEEFRQILFTLLQNAEARQKAGLAALKVIEDNLGASVRIVKAILAN